MAGIPFDAGTLVQSAVKTALDVMKIPKNSSDVGIKNYPTADVGLPQNNVDNTTPIYYPTYGGGGGYSRSGGGGGGGGASAKDAQQKTQAQLNNTGGNYQQRANDLAKNTKGRAGDISGIAKDRLGEMDKNAQAQLNNIQQSMASNSAALAENRRNIMQNVGWQPNQQKQQSMLMALRNRMGNAALGSGIQDLAEGLQRVDDMNDTELINTWKQNENAAYSNWYQANESLVNDYNDQIAAINEQFSQFGADYRDQMSKLKADYNDEMSKLYSQYWSTMSNINPELATKQNLQKAAKNATAVTNAKKVQKATKAMAGKAGTSKVSTKGLTKTQKAAAKIVNKAVNDKSSKGAKAVKKAADIAAKEKVKDAKKQQVSVGKGTDKYTLPNVNLSKPIDFDKYSTLPGQSAALQALMKTRESAPATNPNTAAYIRPDAGYATGGTVDTSRAANTGFSDNLAAFRRV